MISTRRGSDELHGEFAFYERAAALNARFPIENPAPDPKQPFSRQNYVGTLGGAIRPGKLWFFSSFEYVHEDASIAYSPNSQTQFAALSALAAEGLIPGVSSIPVPKNTPVPFNDFLGMLRLDWKQSARSQWFLRASNDSYLTRNDLIQQGALPSTGATSHSNYFNLALGEQYAFSPTWVGTFLFGASGLHRTEARNEQLGFSLQFPFSASFRTVSGLDTFGDNQFATAITAFPVLRNQQKYQLRYDVSHSAGRHAPELRHKFYSRAGIERRTFRHGGNGARLPAGPDFLRGKSLSIFLQPRLRRTAGSHVGYQLHCGPCEQWELLAKCAAPRILRARFLARDETSHRQLWFALRHYLWTF